MNHSKLLKKLRQRGSLPSFGVTYEIYEFIHHIKFKNLGKLSEEFKKEQNKLALYLHEQVEKNGTEPDNYNDLNDVIGADLKELNALIREFIFLSENSKSKGDILTNRIYEALLLINQKNAPIEEVDSHEEEELESFVNDSEKLYNNLMREIGLFKENSACLNDWYVNMQFLRFERGLIELIELSEHYPKVQKDVIIENINLILFLNSSLKNDLSKLSVKLIKNSLKKAVNSFREIKEELLEKEIDSLTLPDDDFRELYLSEILKS